MTAEEVKAKLYGRHPGGAYPMPGPWTCTEEWRSIDFLAFSAWSSASKYARVGYEVKVSRPDLRRELLKPWKRALAVPWCHEFYFAVPKGLLTDSELAFEEPDWESGDWLGERCPGLNGIQCGPLSRKKTHYVRVPVPGTEWGERWTHIVCPTCNGKGALTLSRVEREAPNCWIPKDVGCVLVDGRGCKVYKRSPRRKEVPTLSDMELSALVRWVSIRPDPRHSSVNERTQVA